MWGSQRFSLICYYVLWLSSVCAQQSGYDGCYKGYQNSRVDCMPAYQTQQVSNDQQCKALCTQNSTGCKAAQFASDGGNCGLYNIALPVYTTGRRRKREPRFYNTACTGYGPRVVYAQGYSYYQPTGSCPATNNADPSSPPPDPAPTPAPAPDPVDPPPSVTETPDPPELPTAPITPPTPPPTPPPATDPPPTSPPASDPPPTQPPSSDPPQTPPPPTDPPQTQPPPTDPPSTAPPPTDPPPTQPPPTDPPPTQPPPTPPAPSTPSPSTAAPTTTLVLPPDATCPSGKRTGYFYSQGYQLPGDPDFTTTVDNEQICTEVCTNNRLPDGLTAPCRSADYNTQTKLCQISMKAFPPAGTAVAQNSTGVGHYEKVCVDSNIKCQGPYLRAPQMILIGYAQAVTNATSSMDCLQSCINSQSRFGFTCLSVMYFYKEKGSNCVLNGDTGLAHPELYQPESKDTVDYMEPDCTSSNPTLSSRSIQRRQAHSKPIKRNRNILSPKTDNFGGWTMCDHMSLVHERYKQCWGMNPNKCQKVVAKCDPAYEDWYDRDTPSTTAPATTTTMATTSSSTDSTTTTTTTTPLFPGSPGPVLATESSERNENSAEEDTSATEGLLDSTAAHTVETSIPSQSTPTPVVHSNTTNVTVQPTSPSNVTLTPTSPSNQTTPPTSPPNATATPTNATSSTKPTIATRNNHVVSNATSSSNITTNTTTSTSSTPPTTTKHAPTSTVPSIVVNVTGSGETKVNTSISTNRTVHLPNEQPRKHDFGDTTSTVSTKAWENKTKKQIPARVDVCEPLLHVNGTKSCQVGLKIGTNGKRYWCVPTKKECT